MSTSLQPSSNFDNDNTAYEPDKQCPDFLHLQAVPEKHARKGIVKNYHLGCNTALYCQTNHVYIYFKEN